MKFIEFLLDFQAEIDEALTREYDKAWCDADLRTG